MTTKPHNPSAFPVPEVRASDGTGIMEGRHGMTLRDWFAGQAVAGVLAADPDSSLNDIEVARAAFNIAEAMLAERELP